MLWYDPDVYFLQRHALPIKATFEASLVMAYALPTRVLEPLLPPGLVLDTYRDFGFVSLALVHTRELRPAFMPRKLGISYFLSAYRIYARYRTAAGETLRGLRILRSDTNHWAMRLFGNKLTRYAYELSGWDVQRTDRQFNVRISTPDRQGNVHVEADLTQAALPPNSPFPDLDTARDYAGPLPFTFDYEPQTHSIIRVEGLREIWQPRAVTVNIHRHGFFDQDIFRGASPVLANAFFMENVPYAWRRGIREKLT